MNRFKSIILSFIFSVILWLPLGAQVTFNAFNVASEQHDTYSFSTLDLNSKNSPSATLNEDFNFNWSVSRTQTPLKFKKSNLIVFILSVFSIAIFIVFKLCQKVELKFTTKNLIFPFHSFT